MACVECRQQKVRCDKKDARAAEACSRCRRLKIPCVYSKTYQRQRRPPKTELLRQLAALRGNPGGMQATPAPELEGGSSQPVQTMLGLGEGDPSGPSHLLPSPPSGAAAPLDTDLPPSDAISAAIVPLDSDTNSLSDTSWWLPAQHPVATLDQSLGAVTVLAREIDDCFAIFTNHCLAHVPLVSSLMHPNTCYAQSPLLFWTIVAIGSRKYADNPTLVVLLGPKVSELAKLAIFRQEPVLLTIQAFVLQCAWPMPFHALSNDITPVLAGAALQLATAVGLHIRGNGQEFSRTKVSSDWDQTVARGRLWACCLIVCQRVISTNGTPPIMIPDTYESSLEAPDGIFSTSLQLQKSVSEILTTTILDLQKYALPVSHALLPAALDSRIQSAIDRLHQLESPLLEPIDRFYLQAAELHLLSFHLFKHRDAIDDSVLCGMYELATRLVEGALEVDTASQIAEFGPSFVARLLHSAAIAILRIGRSRVAGMLDLERGRRAYFALILYHRRHSVRQDDAFARFSIILTNLWTSTRIFKGSDGCVDSLRVRSRARLGMSMVYDCFWWWRQEYASQSNVYDNDDGKGSQPRMDNGGLGSSRMPDETESSFADYVTMADLEWPAFDSMLGNDWVPMDTTAML